MGEKFYVKVVGLFDKTKLSDPVEKVFAVDVPTSLKYAKANPPTPAVTIKIDKILKKIDLFIFIHPPSHCENLSEACFT